MSLWKSQREVDSISLTNVLVTPAVHYNLLKSLKKELVRTTVYANYTLRKIDFNIRSVAR